jgi:hypothetical protein
VLFALLAAADHSSVWRGKQSSEWRGELLLNRPDIPAVCLLINLQTTGEFFLT